VIDLRDAFELRSVVHLVRPTGARASDLEQLRAGIVAAPDESLFTHGLQVQLRAPAVDELPPDDFSGWVNGVVQDRETAERLSFAVQIRNGSPQELRTALIEILDSVGTSARAARGCPPGGEFVFLAAESVPLSTGIRVQDAGELIDALVSADASVCFFHLTEEPWGSEGGRFPLAEWIAARGEARLADWLGEARVMGLPIESMRRKIMQRWRRSHLGRRVSDAASAPDVARREAGRVAVARLVRRIARVEERS